MSEEVQRAVREQIQRRTKYSDISKIIDQMQAGTYVPEVSDGALSAINTEDGETARTIWERLKRERNAYIASELEGIWKEVETMWPELEEKVAATVFHDDKNAPHFNDAADFQDATYQPWARALLRWQARHDKALAKARNEWTPGDYLYQRFQKILMLTHRSRALGPNIFIVRGVGTATDATWALMQLVPELALKNKLNLTVDQMADAVKTGFGPLITVLASTNIEIGPVLLRGLWKSNGFGLNPVNFDLVEDGKGSYKLVFDHNALANIKNANGERVIDIEPRSDTTWCPVRYTARGETDVMRAFFTKCLELAKKYYFPYRTLSK